MTAEIRPIQKSDIPGFHEALSSVASEGKYLLTTPPVSQSGIRNFILACIDNNYPQFVAVSDDQVVGWADIIPSARNTMSHVGNLGMGVLSTYRGRGIGTRLLSRVIEAAWAYGLKRLELEVFSDNEIAIAMYKKNGFDVEGVKKFARYHDSLYQDIVIMAQYRV